MQIVVFSSKHTVPVIIDAHCAKNWQGSGLGQHPTKFGTPVFIFAVIEASKFKFAIELGRGQ